MAPVSCSLVLEREQLESNNTREKNVQKKRTLPRDPIAYNQFLASDFGAV